LRAFVVKDVQVNWVTLEPKSLVDRFPGITNTGCFPVGKCNSVDGVGVLVVQDKYVMIAATGGNRELAGLIRVGLQYGLLGKEHAANVMRFGNSGSRSIISVRRRGNVIVIWNGG
jgi:hypothetical protein